MKQTVLKWMFAYVTMFSVVAGACWSYHTYLVATDTDKVAVADDGDFPINIAKTETKKKSVSLKSRALKERLRQLQLRIAVATRGPGYYVAEQILATQSRADEGFHSSSQSAEDF